MASFEITGILKVKGDTVHVSNSFAKREFVIVEDPSGQFPQTVQLQLTQGNCDRLDNVSIGEEISVKGNIQGREWYNQAKEVTQYFNTLTAWSILKPNENPITAMAPTNVKPPPPKAESPQEFIDSNFKEESGDLPF